MQEDFETDYPTFHRFRRLVRRWRLAEARAIKDPVRRRADITQSVGALPFICCLSMSVMASPMCIVALDAAVGFVFDPRGKKRGFHVVAEQHSTAFYGGFLAFPVGWATPKLDFGFVGFYEGFFFPVCINPVCLVGYSTRVPCWVPEMLTLAYISVHSLFAPYTLKTLIFRRFGMKKRAFGFLRKPSSRSQRDSVSIAIKPLFSNGSRLFSH